MRLLDTTTKRLRTFYGKKIPKYAILSHMWGGEEDEVLFRHITGSEADKYEGKMRKGYAKVDRACRQAIEDGWKYIWIDTCCIDKTSSAELSEAINSMYEWYRNSAVCYVYLEDVRSDGEYDSDGDRSLDSDENDSGEELDDDKDEEDSSDKEDDSDEDGEPGVFPIVPFERSRWFTRGWTLQELIAPRFVTFYSKDWIDIGTKASLRDTISTVTRIRVELLIAYDPKKASVAEKMSWAAFRKTTRAEDIAYCLMGLLGVNMPLLYGEGGRAFMRLQEELMKGSDDDSLFAWKCYFNEFEPVNTCGMLAASPWDFRDGINVVRSRYGAYSPYSMTNQGLQIKLPLLPIDLNLKQDMIGTDSESIFKTVLKCTVRDGTPTQWIVIYLKKFRGHYQRIFPHWLNKTETPLTEGELTSLLVPQASAFTTTYRSSNSSFEVEILPTVSGFTTNGRSLVKGYKHSHYSSSFPHHEVISLENYEKCFAVAIGWDRGIPWLDFIDVIDEEQSHVFDSYLEDGSRGHIQERHLDRLFKKIPGGDWWVTVSVKGTGHNSKYNGSFRAVIDIQREPIQAEGWLIPPAIFTSDIFSGKFPLRYRNVHSDFKKEGHDWFAAFNPKVEKKFNVSPLYTLLPESGVHYAQFSRDGKYLATCGWDNMVEVYDMETGAEIYTFTINESTETETYNYICSVCFSPDSQFIAAGDSKGCIKIWDIDARRVHKVLNCHRETVSFLCFLPSGQLVVSGSEDGTVRILWIANGASKTLTIPPDHDYKTGIPSIAISPNGSLLATGSSSGIIRIWDVATTKLLEEFPRHGADVHIAFTPDGKGLVSGSTNRTLKYWDVSGLVRTGTVRRKYDNLGNSGASSALARRDVRKINQPTMTFTGHKRLRVTSVAVSHDGRWLISRLRSRRLVFWDLDDMIPQFVLETAHSNFPLLVTSPAGNMFASTIDDENKTVRGVMVISNLVLVRIRAMVSSGKR